MHKLIVKALGIEQIQHGCIQLSRYTAEMYHRAPQMRGVLYYTVKIYRIFMFDPKFLSFLMFDK